MLMRYGKGWVSTKQRGDSGVKNKLYITTVGYDRQYYIPFDGVEKNKFCDLLTRS